MALGYDKALITTVEGCPATAEIAHQFNEFKLKCIKSVLSEFDPIWLPFLTEVKFDMIYFDGNLKKANYSLF
jgi:hypothetical protein